MRPWRRARRSGRRPSSAFSTRRTGSGRSCGGFHLECEIREHLSRNALPIALSSARVRCAMKEGAFFSTVCRDSDALSVDDCFFVTLPPGKSGV